MPQAAASHERVIGSNALEVNPPHAGAGYASRRLASRGYAS
jgi:hypothetical protein